jgi:hypothetical protein
VVPACWQCCLNYGELDANALVAEDFCSHVPGPYKSAFKWAKHTSKCTRCIRSQSSCNFVSESGHIWSKF